VRPGRSADEPRDAASADSYGDDINRPQVDGPSGYAVSGQRSSVVARLRSRALVIVLAGAVLAASVPTIALAQTLPLAPRVGYAHPGAANTTVVVNLTDTPAFAPSKITIPSNSSVFVHLFNIGNLTHTFTLVALSQANVTLNRSITPAELDAYFAANGSQANVTLAPGQNAWANLTYAASNYTRSFEFVSITPYQFQAGMFGFLNVSSAAPPQVLYDNATSTFSFVPALLSVTPPGGKGATTVAVEITNVGSFPHTWTLVAQSNVSIPTVGYFTSKPPLINVTIPATDGGTAWANFTVPAPGVYEFVCTVPGHFQAGMLGYLYVGVAVTPPPPPPSTAVVEVGVLVGALVLLGIGVLLVGGAGLVGRFGPPRGPDEEHGHP
jgi:uncharacterized cupredoxin-like copper-binding protein